jgi:8-oxo-dGTP pyrophosphatase MutT (NUDIX family)/GNAT superfamily N-acetyltransferase
VRFELVSQRVAALPWDLPDAPAILTPIRLDTGRPAVPTAGRPSEAGGVRGRPAAVLVLLFPDAEGQARVLLTVRVPHLSTHAGEVAFPGGSAEETDDDPIATALRETGEEVGLEPGECGLRVSAVLETFALTVSGFRITPVVALADHAPATIPNPDEVARIVRAPVEAFLPDAPVELEERVIRERLIRYGVYPVEGERVWGATARMLGQLGAALATTSGRTGRPDSAERRSADPPLEGTARIRAAIPGDRAAIDRFLEPLAPELARSLPPATELLIAELAGRIAGLASWAPWDRPRTSADERGFEGLTLPDDDRPAELTLLAVAPALRGRGIGRGLARAAADAAASRRCTRLLAWTLADAACHPSAIAARAFFRGAGFADLAVDRALRVRGEDRLLLSRPIA